MVNWRSNRNVIYMTTNKATVINTDREIMLVDCTRCYVEDYMRSDVGELLLVLVPLFSKLKI